MRHLVIPDDVRPLFKRAAYAIYDAVCADCPEVEIYPTETVVEIVVDGGQLRTLGLDGLREGERQYLRAWLEEHEYDEAYERDMKRAVREAIED